MTSDAGRSFGNPAPPLSATRFPATRTSPGLAFRPAVRSLERNIPWQLDLEARGGRGLYRKTPR